MHAKENLAQDCSLFAHCTNHITLQSKLKVVSHVTLSHDEGHMIKHKQKVMW